MVRHIYERKGNLANFPHTPVWDGGTVLPVRPIQRNNQNMEIIDFSELTFGEIPMQDNPAYDIHPCFLLCRTPDRKKFLVIRIDPVPDPKENETVTKIAEFYDRQLALDFMDAYTIIYK